MITQILLYIVSGISLMYAGHWIGASCRYGMLAYDRHEAKPDEMKSAYQFWLYPFVFIGLCVITKGLYVTTAVYYPETAHYFNPNALLTIAGGVVVIFAGHIKALRACTAAAHDSRQENPNLRKLYKRHAYPIRAIGLVVIAVGIYMLLSVQ